MTFAPTTTGSDTQNLRIAQQQLREIKKSRKRLTFAEKSTSTNSQKRRRTPTTDPRKN